MQQPGGYKRELIPAIETFLLRYPFPLDAFQREAIAHLRADRSVLVAAPTGTGKTVVAEYAIWQALQRQQRVVYTSPLKALSNQKYQDLCRQFSPERVGLVTGDIVEHRNASVLVMTTEVYRNMLLEEGSVDAESRQSFLSQIGVIIFDELHYLSDRQRGPVWEEAIIFSPPHTLLVGLSATIKNASQLADWISLVHRPISLVVSTQRAVPLEHYYLLDGTLHLVQDAHGVRQEYFPHVGGEVRLVRNRFEQGALSGRQMKDKKLQGGNFQKREQLRQPQAQHRRVPFVPVEESNALDGRRRKRHRVATPGEILTSLQKADLLPCLYFLPGRRSVEEAAQQAAAHCFTSVEEQQKIAAELADWQQNLSFEDRALPQVQALCALLPRGLAFHHAGLLPGLKVVIERLFERGYLRAVFATETLVLGVNMPARAVVVGSLSKFDGERMRILTPNEYRQLTGRAGRRGLDSRGAAIIPYSAWEPFEETFAQTTGEQEPVSSSFVIRYHSVLNLWRPGNIAALERLCSSNFHEYQRLLERERRHLQQSKPRRKKGKRARLETMRHAAPAPSQTVLGQQMSQMAASELFGTIQILRNLEYIYADDALTLKGELLRRIVHPAGIVLVELLMRGGLDALPADELAEVCSWLVMESDRRLYNQHRLSRRLQRVHRMLMDIHVDVLTREEQVGLLSVPRLMPDFHGVALCWIRGKSLADLLQQINLAEGDLLMILNQTIDLLRQVHSAVGHVLDAHKTRLISPYDEHLSGWNAESARSSHKRKRSFRQRDVLASLSAIRSRLVQAIDALIHGIVEQSRTIPALTASEEEDFLPFENEEDVDPAEVEAEMEEGPLPLW